LPAALAAATLLLAGGLLALGTALFSHDASSAQLEDVVAAAPVPGAPKLRAEKPALPTIAPAAPPAQAPAPQQRPGRGKPTLVAPALAARSAPPPGERAGWVRADLPAPPPANAQPVAQVAARPEPSPEAALLAQLVAVPEVGLGPLGQRVVSAYRQALNDNISANGSANVTDATPMLRLKPSLATLPLRTGPKSQLPLRAAADLAVLSRKLHDYIDGLAPLRPNGTRAAPKALEKKLVEERRRQRPEWLRVEAVPTFHQILMHEEKPLRRLLVDLLAKIPEARATTALTRRALFDLDPEVRAAATAALKGRKPEDYRPVLLRALRYPWAPAARHAAEALVALRDYPSVPTLVSLLDKPDPAGVQTIGKRTVVQELVRIHHTTNCLLCHAPSAAGKDLCLAPDPFLAVNVPMPTRQVAAMVAAGQIAPGAVSPIQSYYKNGANVTGGGGKGKVNVRVPVKVRFDITFLRQDFSILVPGLAPGPNARFDFVVRTQVISPQQAALLRQRAKRQESYPQRDAVLLALRGLTGQDAGSTSLAWQQLYPDAGVEVESERLLRKLLQADPLQRPLLLTSWRDGKGEAYTRAIQSGAERLTGPAREEVRAALALRLADLASSPLRGYLHAGKPVLRQAAVLACERRKDPTLVLGVIGRLDDRDGETARLARSALKALTGQDFDNTAAAEMWWAQGRRLVRR
jgi:hypothetical protein